MNEPAAPLPYSAAAERNREPILAVLKDILPAAGTILEIGSGSGQHVVYFAHALPAWIWQPSEMPDALPGLKARLADEGGANIRPPLVLDVTTKEWPATVFDALYSANTAHIMPWKAVLAMLAGAGRLLRPGGLFALYGPFHDGGRHDAPSNIEFDAWLKQRDPEMGVRDALALAAAARRHGLEKIDQRSMPANNRILVFNKAA